MRPSIHLIDVTGFELTDGTKSTDWFRDAFEALGLLEKMDFRSYDGTARELPDLSLAARPGHGIVVTGSSGPVFEKKPWTDPLLGLLRNAHEKNAWILGVCFGQHALAVALGGEVVFNPRGRELGTELVYLTKEGERCPLFEGFASGDKANLAHRTHVSRMPAGAVRLAFNRMTPTQAFQLGRSFGVQPHPELTPVQLRGFVELYGKVLTGREHFVDDREHLQNVVGTFQETPSFRLILRNFARMIVGE